AKRATKFLCVLRAPWCPLCPNFFFVGDVATRGPCRGPRGLTLERDPISSNRMRALDSLFVAQSYGEPVSTSPDCALDRDGVAQIAERHRPYPLAGGSEDGVAERGRERRKCGFAHAGGRKIRLDEIRLDQPGCEGHAQGRIIVVV